MKFMRLFFMSLFMVTGIVNAESFYIVKITDMLGNDGYQIMNSEEFSAASKEIMEENKIFRKVLADCKKEWSQDEKHEGSFQSSKVKVRKIAKSGAMFTNMEKAGEKLAKLEERASEKHIAELDEHAKKWKKFAEDDIEKETAKLKEWKESFEMVTKKLEEELGRKIPSYGFDLIAPDPTKKH